MGTRKTPLDARIFHLAAKTLSHSQQAAEGSDQGDAGHRGCPRPCPGAVTPAQERPSPSPGAGMSCEQLCGGELLKHTESFFYGKIPSQLSHKLCILGAAVTWSWGQENRTLVWKIWCYAVISNSTVCPCLGQPSRTRGNSSVRDVKITSNLILIKAPRPHLMCAAKQHREFSPAPCESLGKAGAELEGLRAPSVGHSSGLPTLASAQFSPERKDPTAQTATRKRPVLEKGGSSVPMAVQGTAGLAGLLTCQGATETSLQHHSQAEKGKGQVEIPVLRALHSHVATVHLGILLCRGNSQVPQVTLPQAWKMGRGKSESADREQLRAP